MMPNKIKDVNLTMVHCDDWTGLYINGKLAIQNHSIRIEDVFDLFEGQTICFQSIVHEEITNFSYNIEDFGKLPETLDELNSN